MAGETTAAVPTRGRPTPHGPNEPKRGRGRPRKEKDEQLVPLMAHVEKEQKTALAAVAGGPGKVSAYIRRLIDADPAIQAKLLEESTMTG